MAASVFVTCLCGKNVETFQLGCSLPFEGTACFCNLCRYSTGVLYYSCLPLVSIPNVANLRKYNTSNKLTRYFCSDCGTHMFVYNILHKSWAVSSGAIDRVVGHEQVLRPSLETPVQLEFVGDTKDGGLAVCLADFNNQPVSVFVQGPDGPGIGLPLNLHSLLQTSGHHPTPAPPTALTVEDGAREVKLLGSCHCGGVSFNVTRPGPESRECSSPFPDLLVPYHSSPSANPEDVKWWLRDGDSKYLAGTCACRSCRLASGSPVQAWAFIPKANLRLSDGSPVTSVPFGTLTQIESSPDCLREFCSICGATVFWHCRERPDLFDVSVGVLRAVEGSRAESWLEWCTDRVSFKEDAFDNNLIANLEHGLKSLKQGTPIR